MKTTKGISMYYTEAELLAFMEANDLPREAARLKLTNKIRYERRKAGIITTTYTKKPVIDNIENLLIRAPTGKYMPFNKKDKVHVELYTHTYTEKSNGENNTSRDSGCDATDRDEL